MFKGILCLRALQSIWGLVLFNVVFFILTRIAVFHLYITFLLLAAGKILRGADQQRHPFLTQRCEELSENAWYSGIRTHLSGLIVGIELHLEGICLFKDIIYNLPKIKPIMIDNIPMYL